jgi:diguanylate cyclase (GGDEF)-like protein
MNRTAPVPLPPEELLARIDQGIQAHLEWNQRLLRCAVLRESPGDDILGPEAHRQCRLGAWLDGDKSRLAGFDAVLTVQIRQQHEKMHGAVRRMCICVLGGVPADPADLKSFEESQTTLVALLTRLREKISAVSVRRDALTGLPLRHGLEHAFAQRQHDAARSGAIVHLVMIDIDHFKQVNDTHGHLIGDLGIRHTAGLLASTLRKSDVLIRFGGEEFLAILLNAEPNGATATAQRLLEAFRKKPLRTADLELPLRVTIGLAKVGPREPLAVAIDRADRALLLGKQQGRDRAVFADEPLPDTRIIGP